MQSRRLLAAIVVGFVLVLGAILVLLDPSLALWTLGGAALGLIVLAVRALTDHMRASRPRETTSSHIGSARDVGYGVERSRSERWPIYALALILGGVLAFLLSTFSADKHAGPLPATTLHTVATLPRTNLPMAPEPAPPRPPRGGGVDRRLERVREVTMSDRLSFDPGRHRWSVSSTLFLDCEALEPVWERCPRRPLPLRVGKALPSSWTIRREILSDGSHPVYEFDRKVQYISVSQPARTPLVQSQVISLGTIAAPKLGVTMRPGEQSRLLLNAPARTVFRTFPVGKTTGDPQREDWDITTAAPDEDGVVRVELRSRLAQQAWFPTVLVGTHLWTGAEVAGRWIYSALGLASVLVPDVRRWVWGRLKRLARRIRGTAADGLDAD